MILQASVVRREQASGCVRIPACPAAESSSLVLRKLQALPRTTTQVHLGCVDLRSRGLEVLLKRAQR